MGRRWEDGEEVGEDGEEEVGWKWVGRRGDGKDGEEI